MSQRKTPEPNLGAIADAADDAESKVEAESSDERIGALEDRLASIEPLLEQLQANALLGPQLMDYVGDLRDEQVFFNRARYAVGGLSLVIILGLVALTTLAIFHPSSPLLSAPPVAIATFMIGMVSGMALILNSFVKGVFRSTTERHADGFLPPALEKGVEILHKVNGKSN